MTVLYLVLQRSTPLFLPIHHYCIQCDLTLTSLALFVLSLYEHKMEQN